MVQRLHGSKSKSIGINIMSTAIAILKSGRSFDEASKITGISVDLIMAEWQKLTRKTT